MPASRQDRIQYAESLILRDSTTSKRGLQSKLKTEFGVGLSDTMRRGLLQKANTPAVLRSRVQTRAFTRNERRILRDFLRRGNPPYLKDVINHRYMMARQAKNQGLTYRQFRRMVKQEAIDHGWLIKRSTRPTKRFPGRKRGQIDILAVLRDFRDSSIEQGDYIPPVRPKPRTDKGKVKVQKRRYSERQAERERTRIKGWIAQKNMAILRASGERRNQLKREKENLERQLRHIQ